MLQLKNLLCSRNDSVLFKKIDCNLQPGQVLQITGANGSGKSTLLRTIAGFLQPHSGQIVKDELNMCYIGHRSGLHPDLTVKQNLLFIHAFLKSDNNNKELAVEKCLNKFSLKNKMEQKLSALSAGQAQQISLSRLCISSAKLWILDEPLAHLDQTAAQILQSMCLEHLQKHGSLVLATHKQLDFAPFIMHNLVLEK